jgi:hypothetical protein
VRWLLLIHHLPPEPAYLRVKVRRQLDRIGAVAVKSSVYAIPASEEALEDLQWLLQEILLAGGEGSLAEATFVDGDTNARLVERFREVSSTAYLELANAASDLKSARAEERAGSLEGKARRLRSRLEELKQVDHFHAEGRDAADRAVSELIDAAEGGRRSSSAARIEPLRVGSGRTWATRRGVKVDRIASAWLIKRFIDPRARFVFVDPDASTQEPGTLRFDMFEGEFTHEGGGCTFETLVSRFRLDEPALRALGEIVHDIDCKDEKFGRQETAGVASIVDGIVRAHSDDRTRLARGTDFLDALLEHFRARLV